MPVKSMGTHFVSQSRILPRRIAADIRTLKKQTRVHYHGFLELELVIGGSGEQLLNGHTIKLSRGSVTLLRFTDYHRIIPDGPLECINISFDKSLLSEELQNRIDLIPGELYRELDGESLSVIEAIGQLLVNEKGIDTAEPDEIHVGYAVRLIECLLIKLLNYKFPCAADNNEPSRLGPIIFVLKQIHESFKSNLKLADIAAELHYNPRHLSALFHRELGMTYSDYLTKTRLDHAKRLLIMTELNIDYVGMECGFNTASNFRRLFRESVGMTPGQFRRMSRG